MTRFWIIPHLSQCPKSTREAAKKAFDCCQYCGAIEGSYLVGHLEGVQFHIDRIVPGAKGGSYIKSNVTISCSACNRAKGESESIGPVRSLADMEAVQ